MIKHTAKGKRIGSSLYLHRSEEWQLPQEQLAAARAAVDDPPYDYIKFDTKSGAFTFSECVDFDVACEPVVGRQWRVCDGATKLLMPQSDPMILHGKHLFVSPEYAGFDAAEAAARFESFTAAPWVDKSRMGRLSWWYEHAYQSGRLSRYQSSSTGQMGATSRAAGAVGQLPVLYRHVAAGAGPGRVLDYGCGRPGPAGVRPGSAHMAAAGMNVVGYDRFHASELDSLAGCAAAFDAVVAANVLNVQRCRQDVILTLWEVAWLLAPGGRFFCSYPESPRHAGLTVADLIDCLWGAFGCIRRHAVGGAEIFVCSAPLPPGQRRYCHGRS